MKQLIAQAVEYLPNFITDKDILPLTEILMQELDWEQYPIKMFGKVIMQPRLICFYGDEGVKYRYSRRDYFARLWHSELLKLKNKIELQTQSSFNTVLCNLYRDGRDSMGAHSDDEPELGRQPMIASLSFGASRNIIFRHKVSKQKVNIKLDSGSLLVMSGECQKDWTHEIPKTNKEVSPRINLTFRQVLSVK